MDEDKMNSTFDFDNDPEFSANFYKNIEMVLGESGDLADETANNSEFRAEEEAEITGVESAATLQIVEEMSDEDIDNQLIDINTALAKQICTEMDATITEEAEFKEAKHKKVWRMKIQSGIALTFLCIIGMGFFLGFTKPGNNLLMSMGVNLGGSIWEAWTGNFNDKADVIEDIDYIDKEDLEAEGEEIDPSTIVWPNTSGEGRQEKGVYNILLLGEEAIGSGSSRGRTDVIVIATMNTNDNTVKLTSLMRDMLVQIPGFLENKINTSYEKGGLDLLYETIALNLDVKLDGCVMVNFESFEKIIDELGGIKITLTTSEANYLNTTNYISNPSNRNVIAGTQLMNGNQVLGYSRVRKRANINGTNNDYGRTERHRIILNAIFDKYKTTSKTELASLMFKFLPMITTDIDSKAFELFLNSFIQMGTTEIEQLRIPADGTFKDNVKVRGMSVLIPDLEENIDILHSFIFDDDLAQNTEQTNTEQTNTDSSVILGLPEN